MAILKYAFTAPDADIILVANGAPNADDVSATGNSCTTEFSNPVISSLHDLQAVLEAAAK